MLLEVENKYPIVDGQRLSSRLRDLGAEPLGIVEQSDTYYGHPARDFAATDEALRIRRSGDQARLTYKGPKLDSTTKTRRELELPLTAADQWHELLVALGFGEVATVRKRRERWQLERWQLERLPFRVEVCIDRVADLGQFAEIEIVADDSQLAAARDVLAQLAGELRLARPERRSYLELLLAKR